jgi:hypothetical protein
MLNNEEPASCVKQRNISFSAVDAYPEEDEEDLRQPLVADSTDNIKLPLQIAALNFLLWGNGWLVPVPLIMALPVAVPAIVYSITSIVCLSTGSSSMGVPCNIVLPPTSAQIQTQLWTSACNFAWVVEIIVNTYFGFTHCRDRRLENIVQWAASTSKGEVRKRASLQMLSKLGWVAWGVLGVLASMVIVPSQEEGGDNSTKTLLLNAWTRVFGWGPSVYLCFLWLWVNHAMHGTGQAIVKSFDRRSVASRTDEAGQSLLHLLSRMSEVSSHWAFNHSVRLATSTISATAYLVVFIQEGYSRGYWVFLVWSAILYVMVWITAAAPGYVSDLLFNALQRRLARISTFSIADIPKRKSLSTDVLVAMPTGGAAAADASGDQSISFAPALPNPNLEEDRKQSEAGEEAMAVMSKDKLLVKATLLMQRATCLRPAMGMHFMGVPMSMQKAASVGTLLCYLIAAVVNNHGY